ncbi:MAG: endonuclease III [Candidatus Bathyarchaeia archaeon]
MSGEMSEYERVKKILALLEREHPDAKVTLEFSNPLELLVATILAAQCTDAKVNQITKTLFKKYKTAEDYANADLTTLENEIKSTGFYRAKAKRIKDACQVLVDRFGSKVPQTMDDLLKVPGVARKTANIVLSNAYGKFEGIAVDTHVLRLVKRLGLVKSRTREKIEADLMQMVPKESWLRFSDLLVFHGRRVCNAKKPKCNQCALKDLCPSAFSF